MIESFNSKTIIDGYVMVTTDEVHQILPVVIERDIPLRRKRKDGSYGFIPPKDFDHFMKDQDMMFYIDEDSFKKLLVHDNGFKEKYVAPEMDDDPVAAPPTEPLSLIDEGFKNELDQATEMDITERIQAIMNQNYKMKGFIEEGRKFDPATIKDISDIFATAICLNKATFQDNLSVSIPQDKMHQIVGGSRILIDNLLKLMATGKASFRDLARLDHIQTGSITLNHMNRMLIRFISFLFFYNSFFQKFSNEIKKYRAHFKSVFYPYYDKVVQGSQNISLEIVFKGGIKPIAERGMFIEYAMGGFMHDVGKLPQITYHDGNEEYDFNKVTRHVFDGFNMLLESKEFQSGVISSSLLHHDYYNAPYGYNQLETFRKKFIERRAVPRDTSPTKYFISYNIADVGYGLAFSYFPNKILEILDVFDAMTDEKKKYGDGPKSVEEAVKVMRLEYIEGEHLGIDPIMYNIFLEFLKVSGLLVDPSFVEAAKVKKI